MPKEFDEKAHAKRKDSRHLSGSREIVQRAAVSEVRRGDLRGSERGVFHAGLCACALGADSAEESRPFVERLAREAGEPGWALACAALEADSAPMLEALIESGALSLDEKVWSGYNSKDGEASREVACAEQAVHLGAHRCLKYLVERARVDGLLAKAVEAGHPRTFAALLERARALGLQSEMDEALAALADRPNRRLDADCMDAGEMSRSLVEAGARLSFRAGSPIEWASWNGSTPGEIDWAWVPALRLCEAGEALPVGATREGAMEGKAFFAQWSSACRFVRSAIEGGAEEQGWSALRALDGWETAASEGSALSPLALMAMTDPATTDSKLRRARLDTREIVLGSRMLDAALAEEGP